MTILQSRSLAAWKARAGAPVSTTAKGAPWCVTTGLPPASTAQSASRKLCRPLAITPIRAIVTHLADWSMVIDEKKFGVPSAATQARSIRPPNTQR